MYYMYCVNVIYYIYSVCCTILCYACYSIKTISRYIDTYRYRYLTVFSQKLAIQGPPGSVIRSVTFLKSYETHILRAFTLNLIITGLSSIFQFYVFMQLRLAYFCTLLMLVGMSLWAKYALDVYNHCKYIDPALQEMYSTYLYDDNDNGGDVDVDGNRVRDSRNSFGIPFAYLFKNGNNQSESDGRDGRASYNIDEGDLESGDGSGRGRGSGSSNPHKSVFSVTTGQGAGKDNKSNNNNTKSTSNNRSISYRIGTGLQRVFKRKSKTT